MDAFVSLGWGDIKCSVGTRLASDIGGNRDSLNHNDPFIRSSYVVLGACDAYYFSISAAGRCGAFGYVVVASCL